MRMSVAVSSVAVSRKTRQKAAARPGPISGRVTRKKTERSADAERASHLLQPDRRPGHGGAHRDHGHRKEHDGVDDDQQRRRLVPAALEQVLGHVGAAQRDDDAGHGQDQHGSALERPRCPAPKAHGEQRRRAARRAWRRGRRRPRTRRWSAWRPRSTRSAPWRCRPATMSQTMAPTGTPSAKTTTAATPASAGRVPRPSGRGRSDPRRARSRRVRARPLPRAEPSPARSRRRPGGRG